MYCFLLSGLWYWGYTHKGVSMKDFLGNELQVGDEVVCIELNHKKLKKVTISKITEKTIFVEYSKWANKEIVKRYSDQVVKI